MAGEATLRVDGGRQLGWLDAGPPDAPVVFHLHGVPGSRHEAAGTVTTGAGGARVRGIALDRAGYGLSEPDPEATVESCADDVIRIADYLGIERFLVLGFSAGASFATALAARAPERVRGLVLAGAPAVPLLPDPCAHAGALTAAVWRTARDNPEDLPAMIAPLADDPVALATGMLDAMSVEDQALFTSGQRGRAFRDCMDAALAAGPAAAISAMGRDMRILVDPANAPKGPLPVPVHIVHGCGDTLVHAEHARALATELPGADLHLLDDCGHYGVLYDTRTGAILEHWQ